MNDARGSCGDYVRLEKLSGEPATFLDLFKSLILDDLTKVPGTPRYIPHAEWDKYSAKIEKSGTEMEKISMKYLIILRTKHICMLLRRLWYLQVEHSRRHGYRIFFLLIPWRTASGSHSCEAPPRARAGQYHWDTIGGVEKDARTESRETAEQEGH